MVRHSGLLVGCAGAMFAVASFLIGLEVSSTATTAAPSVEQTTVNRSLKGDRMQIVPSKSRNAVNGPFEIKAPQSPAALPELLDGCEPVISSIGQTPLAKIAGRCVS
jgi:hypothetical protein